MSINRVFFCCILLSVLTGLTITPFLAFSQPSGGPGVDNPETVYSLIIDSTSALSPLNITESSSAPSSPNAQDIYLDDGTGCSGSSPCWKRYTGSTWEEIVGDAGTLAATYITQTASGTLTNEQALSALATGILKSTTSTGVVSIATASDLPIVDGGGIITGTEVETALQENRTAINLNTAKVTESTTVSDTASVDLTLTTYDITADVIPGGVDHGSLAGLTDDDHTQYPLLLGRSGGQTLIGGTGSGDDLTLTSTSHATKGTVALDGTLYVDGVNTRVGVNTISPDRSLEVLDASNPQLRLTHTDSSKYADFQVDTNHDLILTPSSTGQIKLQPTTDQADFFQALDADGGTPIFNVDSVNERIGIGTDSPGKTLDIVGEGRSTLGWNVNSGTANVLRVQSTQFLGRDGTNSTKILLGHADNGFWTGIGLFVGGGGASTERLSIIQNGNIGIGVVAPTGKLHVVGDADVEQLLVQSNATQNDDVAQIGDVSAGNYATIEDDGTLELIGDATVWDDVNIGGMILQGPAVSRPGTVEINDNTGTGTGIYTLGFAVGENGGACLEVPHWYKEGSDFTLHVHWTGNDAPSGTDYVKWQAKYFYSDTDEVIPAATTITVETAYDTQYERVNSDFTAITGTTVEMGNQFCFDLERVAAVGDAYAGDASITTVGIHFEKDTMGSRQITTK